MFRWLGSEHRESEIVKRRDMIFSRARIIADFDYFVQEKNSAFKDTKISVKNLPQ